MAFDIVKYKCIPDRCPLCSNHKLGSHSIRHYYTDKKRHYWQCLECCLVFVAKNEQLSAQAEKAEYDLHENSLEDAGYLNFLNRLAAPLMKTLPKHSQGLDFGCGPAPALAHLLEQHGHSVALYDVYYQTEASVLKQHYDFICCTETIEHLSEPGKVVDQLWKQIKPGGILAIMTKRVIDLNTFKSWHYKNDPTHISFFSLNTFQYLASKLSASLTVIDKDIVFFKKETI